MNRYGNKYGFHSPEKTKATLKKLNSAFEKHQWLDSSWHNDACDSAALEISDDFHLNVYIPNSNKQDLDHEEFNTYSLSENLEFISEFKTLEEVINYIKTNYNGSLHII